MFRMLKWIVILAVLLVVVVLAGTVVYVDPIVKAAVEQGGTYALGVPTTLEKADIGLLSGRFGLDGLVIANPKGFDSPHFLRMGHAGMALALPTLLEDTIRAPELVLEGLDLHVERSKGKTNYGVVLDNLGRFESGEAPAEEPPPTEGEGGKAFVLERLVIRDVTAHFDIIPLVGDVANAKVSIPEILVEDVGQEMSLGKLLSIIVKAVLQSAVEAGKGIVPDDLLKDLQGGLGALTGVVVNVTGSVTGGIEVLGGKAMDVFGEQVGNLQEQLDDTVGGLKKSVDGLQEKVGGQAGEVLKGVGEGLEGAQEGLTKGLSGLLKKKDEKKDDSGGGGQ